MAYFDFSEEEIQQRIEAIEKVINRHPYTYNDNMETLEELFIIRQLLIDARDRLHCSDEGDIIDSPDEMY